MIKKIIIGIGGVFGLFLFLGIFYFFSYRIPEFSYGTTLLDDKGEIYYHILSPREEWHVEGTGEISEKLKKAVLCYEDKRFETHCGVDIYAIARALTKNILQKKRSGGSTITMQLVKSLSPKKRTYFHKYMEIWQALRLETMLSKKEILQLYLNLSPYGGNIRGYETASQMYFRKKSKDLSWAQAALLAVLPNAPGQMYVEKNRAALKRKRDYVLKLLQERGELSEEEYHFAIQEQLPQKRYSLNKTAFHFARKLFAKYPGKTLHTSLNFVLQKKIEIMAKNYQHELQKQKIQDVAILLLDNKTAQVKAYYGSSSYWDMLVQKRSPGSTLKPFLYALAIEDGLILPESLYPDVPSFFGNFSPSNVDGKFRGMVPIEEALQNSYNLPFVYLLQDYGANRFFYFLQSNLNQKSWKNKAGLSLILGSQEFSALDLAYFYLALANEGIGRDIALLEKDDTSRIETTKRRVFEKGSAILTGMSLRKVKAPKEYEIFQKEEEISWKTGTSYGRKDAWACGFSKDWTLIVWAGNINHEGNENLQGLETAGKLFFRIFKELPKKSEGFSNFEKEFRTIKIDEKTGYRWIVDSDIPWKEVKAPKNGKMLRESPYWKKIFINPKGKEIDSRDSDFIYRKETFVLNYPEEVKKFYQVKDFYGNQLKIIYPKENLHIYLPQDLHEKKKMLFQVSNPRKESLYWYLNGKYLGNSDEEERSFFLFPGFYELTVVSENYETAQVSFTVEREK